MSNCPESAGRSHFDIGEIVRRHWRAFAAKVYLSSGQCKALSAMAQCRTPELGGHLDKCESCGLLRPSYNSCRNRHCPKCQGIRQQQWIEARSELVLSVQHFHVVFTLPSGLRALSRYAPREIYSALFASASRTLLALGKTRLCGQLGITMVLHTWTRELHYL
jgi:hypothetical protein